MEIYDKFDVGLKFKLRNCVFGFRCLKVWVVPLTDAVMKWRDRFSGRVSNWCVKKICGWVSKYGCKNNCCLERYNPCSYNVINCLSFPSDEMFMHFDIIFGWNVCAFQYSTL